MPEMLLVRLYGESISQSDREAVRRVVFGQVDGLGDVQQRRWRRFWTWLLRLQPGELVRVSTVMERSSPFHRRHFAMEQAVFAAQEQIGDFEVFRAWGKVGAGWVAWAAGPDGTLAPIPRSVSFASADQGQFEEYHMAWCGFMRSAHACRFLWPHLSDLRADEMMFAILEEFAKP